MKLIDIEPKLEALEKGLAKAHERIDLVLEREKQILDRLDDLSGFIKNHAHDDDLHLAVEQAVEEATETVQEAAEVVEEVADVVEETAEEVVDAFTAHRQKQVEEESDDDDATFPEASKTEEKVKVEPVLETDDAPPVDDYVEVINKETGKTHRIHRDLLAEIVQHV